MVKLVKRPIKKDREYGLYYLGLGILSIGLGVAYGTLWADRSWLDYVLAGIWVLIGLHELWIARLYLTDDEPEIPSVEYPTEVDGYEWVKD